jgi:hypothetical protein
MPLALQPFRVEVTPPPGSWLCGGLSPQATTVAAPVWLRGIVLTADGERHVIAVVDYCYLVGRSQARLEAALAAGAGIPPERVAVQSNHTHAAPLLNEEAHAFLQRHRPELVLHDEAYFADVLERARAAVAAACAAPPQPVAGIGFASHAVREFASTRRVRQPDGTIGVRWSITGNQAVRHAPEGLIDPLLDLVTWYGEAAQPLASLAFYACHPQVGYLDGVVHGDTPGVALPLFEQTYPGTFPLYFDGCGGDITGGKYTRPNVRRNNLEFGLKLFDALEEAHLKSRPEPVGPWQWRTVTFDCPLAPVGQSRAELLELVRGEGTARSVRFLAAIKLERLESGRLSYPCRFTRVQVGDIAMLFLPSELCVPYQLFAKARYRGRLAVAAYGDSYLGYVATDAAFTEGGYEVDPLWTEVGPGIEGVLRQHLAALLDQP